MSGAPLDVDFDSRAVFMATEVARSLLAQLGEPLKAWAGFVAHLEHAGVEEADIAALRRSMAAALRVYADDVDPDTP